MSRLFVATADQISFGDQTTFDGLTKATWAGFLYLTSTADGIMWGKWGSASSNQSFLMETKVTNLAFSLAVRDEFEVLLVKQANNLIETHKFMHLAFVWSGANNVSIYKNGVSRAITNVANNSPANIRTTTAVETFGKPDASASATLGAYEQWGAWSTALNAGEIGELAAGEDPINIRPSALVALPTFNRQGVIDDRKRKLVIKPTGTRPFRDPPQIVRRRVIGLDLGTSPPPPPPSNTNYLMPMLGVGDD